MATLELPMDRRLHLSSEVTRSTIQPLVDSILSINVDDAHLAVVYKSHGMAYARPPIELYIDSPGGAVYSCLGLLGVMGQSETPVHTLVTGAAMSAAFTILACGHKRYAYEHATMMQHQAAYGAWGTIKEISDTHKEMKKLNKKLNRIILDHTYISKKQLLKFSKMKQDWYMDAKLALKLGVVDGIIS